ncbi:MAG: DUF4352 domain-containing protein, partial [Halovenus sp.]
SRMDRREYLAAVGTTLVLAGCGGGDETTSGGNEQESTKQPTEPSNDEEDDEKDDETTGETDEDSSSSANSLEDRVTYGRVSVTITEIREIAQFEVETDGIRETIERVEADDGSVFAFVHARVENEGDEEVEGVLGDAFRAIADGTQLQPDSTVPTPRSWDITRFDDESDSTLLAGASMSGWLCFEVPSDVDQVRVAFSPPTGWEGETAYWTAPVDARDPPRLSLEYEIPESVEWGEPVSVTGVVENTGGSAGDYQFAVEEFEQGNDPRVYEESGTVSGGETARASVDLHPPEVGEWVVVAEPEIDSGDIGREPVGEVEVVPARLAVGESISAPNGARVTVHEIVLADEVSYEMSWGDVETATAEGGNQFACIDVSVENTSGDNVTAPSQSHIAAIADGAEYTDTPIGETIEEFTDPMSGERVWPTSSFGASERARGWAVREIPASATRENVAAMVQWNHQASVKDGYAIRWSPD